MSFVRAGFYLLLLALLGALAFSLLWLLASLILGLPGVPGVHARPLQIVSWVILLLPCLWVGMELCWKQALGPPERRGGRVTGPKQHVRLRHWIHAAWQMRRFAPGARSARRGASTGEATGTS